jgi:hypothetical protein
VDHVTEIRSLQRRKEINDHQQQHGKIEDAEPVRHIDRAPADKVIETGHVERSVKEYGQVTQYNNGVLYNCPRNNGLKVGQVTDTKTDEKTGIEDKSHFAEKRKPAHVVLAVK